MLSQFMRWFALALGLSGCSVFTDVDRTKIVDPMFVRPPPGAGAGGASGTPTAGGAAGAAGASGMPSAGTPAAGGGAGAAGMAGAGPDAG